MKAKQFFVISTHSFVDLITNSSSELFVCDTDKTMAAVKELLKTLLKNHDAIEGETHSFCDVFGTIKPSKYCFNWWDVPEAIRDEYKKYHDYCPFGRNHFSIFSSDDRSPEQQELEEKEREIALNHNAYEKGLYERDKAEYERRWKMFRASVDALWTDFGANALRMEKELFIEFLKQNKFALKLRKDAAKVYDRAIAKHISEKQGKHPFPIMKFSAKVSEAHEVFREWKSWGITAKKGDIFVYSASDNTVPYKLMDTIRSYLNAESYHLG